MVHYKKDEEPKLDPKETIILQIILRSFFWGKRKMISKNIKELHSALKFLIYESFSFKFFFYIICNKNIFNTLVFKRKLNTAEIIFFKTLDNNFIKTLDKYKLLNFCRILEIHNLNGMAAEILLKNKEKFNSKEIKKYLDKLCEKSSLDTFGEILDYQTFIFRIGDNPKVLFNNIW